MLLGACHSDSPLIFCPAVRLIISQPAIKIRDSEGNREPKMGVVINVFRSHFFFFPIVVKVEWVSFIGKGHPGPSIFFLPTPPYLVSPELLLL